MACDEPNKTKTRTRIIYGLISHRRYNIDENCIMTGPFRLTLSNIRKASRASCTCCFVSGGIGNSLMMFLFDFSSAME